MEDILSAIVVVLAITLAGEAVLRFLASEPDALRPPEEPNPDDKETE